MEERPSNRVGVPVTSVDPVSDVLPDVLPVAVPVGDTVRCLVPVHASVAVCGPNRVSEGSLDRVRVGEELSVSSSDRVGVPDQERVWVWLGWVRVGVYVTVHVDWVPVRLQLPGVTVLRVWVIVFAQLRITVGLALRIAVKGGVLVAGLAVRVQVGGEGVQVKM